MNRCVYGLYGKQCQMEIPNNTIATFLCFHATHGSKARTTFVTSKNALFFSILDPKNCEMMQKLVWKFCYSNNRDVPITFRKKKTTHSLKN